MLELLSLALFVVAVVAINKANGAIKENAALRAELERLGISLIGIAYLYRWLEPEGETKPEG
jgi:hypothetical protein